MEKIKFKICQYPTNGFGAKNGRYYLLSRWGKIYEFSNEFDNTINESYWLINVDGNEFSGKNIHDIVADMNGNGYKIDKF